MKVALGSKIIHGPWGGGNLFTINLKKYLIKNNIEVVTNLIDPDIDIVLLTEPRVESATSTITSMEALLYKKFVNKNTKIVHRINECDERKNTNYVNKKMISISSKSDFTIFVSSWIKNLYQNIGIDSDESEVVLSGSDNLVFNHKGKIPWNGKSKLKLVTHHWGNNWNKGFEVYSYIDKLLDSEEFNSQFEFTYIGNLAKNFKFKNVSYIKPLNGFELSEELKKHDLYITGSLNEPSGNHHIEGALCGLPVLYINSGGISEYQEDFGSEYTLANLSEKLFQIRKEYSSYYRKNLAFPFYANQMSEKYLNIFLKIFSEGKTKKISLYLIIYRFFYSLKFISLIKKILAKLIYQLRKYDNYQ